MVETGMELGLEEDELVERELVPGTAEPEDLEGDDDSKSEEDSLPESVDEVPKGGLGGGTQTRRAGDIIRPGIRKKKHISDQVLSLGSSDHFDNYLEF